MLGSLNHCTHEDETIHAIGSVLHSFGEDEDDSAIHRKSSKEREGEYNVVVVDKGETLLEVSFELV